MNRKAPIYITVDTLIEELKEISKEGYGDMHLFVPAECGYSGASIVKGWDREKGNNYIRLHSDDMD